MKNISVKGQFLSEKGTGKMESYVLNDVEYGFKPVALPLWERTVFQM